MTVELKPTYLSLQEESGYMKLNFFDGLRLSLFVNGFLLKKKKKKRHLTVFRNFKNFLVPSLAF